MSQNSSRLQLALAKYCGKIPEECIPCMISGRPVLHSVRCDNGKMLEACQRHDGVKNVEKMHGNDGTDEGDEAVIASMFEESMFHSQTNAEDDGISDVYDYAEFGTDTLKEIHSELAKRIDEAVAEGLPANKKDTMRKILQMHRNVFILCLGNDA